MISFKCAFDVPKREPLSVKTAAAIRKAIDEGAWREFLPGGRSLCEILQVSRPTVQTAFHLLARDGLIRICQGRRNQIVSRRRRGGPDDYRLVVIVTRQPTSRIAISTYRSIIEMRASLADRGFAVVNLVCNARSSLAQRRKIEEFERQNHVFCFILLSVERELQRWFSERSLPSLVLGSCHAGVNLPSLDVDNRAVCRHAYGVFSSKGHERIALIVADSGLAGDLASEQGFLEAAERRARNGAAQGIVVRHNGTAQNINAKLQLLFDSAHPPTALLVAEPQYVFVVLLYLLKRGHSVPETVSLISRDPDNLFSSVTPPISHYHFKSEVLSRRVTHLVVQAISNGNLPRKSSLIFPRFFAGGTVRNLIQNPGRGGGELPA